MKATEIQHIIQSEYRTSKPISITNYTGVSGFEADIVMITKSGFAYEYEVKISRADFKKDFTKTVKHAHLSGKKQISKTFMARRKYPLVCNHFYYVVPDSLVSVKEIPEYAGLIYIRDGKPVVIKKAKKLHSYKVTDHILWNICSAHTARSIHGSSYLKYSQRLKNS